jgi:hypothetical protein
LFIIPASVRGDTSLERIAMTIEQWGIVVGALVSVSLALVPWMFMVHARLAVLAVQLSGLEQKVDKLIAESDRRGPICALHEARLDSQEAQLDQIGQRLRDVE